MNGRKKKIKSYSSCARLSQRLEMALLAANDLLPVDLFVGCIACGYMNLYEHWDAFLVA